MSEQIKDFIAAVNGPRGCLDGWLETANESEVRDAIKAVMRAPTEQSLPAMSLRDYFAAHAPLPLWNMDLDEHCAYCYRYADAMLAAREVKA